MQANDNAPGDCAPGSEDPALFKMSNQRTEPKLNDKHNTHDMPVRTRRTQP